MSTVAVIIVKEEGIKVYAAPNSLSLAIIDQRKEKLEYVHNHTLSELPPDIKQAVQQNFNIAIQDNTPQEPLPGEHVLQIDDSVLDVESKEGLNGTKLDSLSTKKLQ